jgi:hypothetical protein
MRRRKHKVVTSRCRRDFATRRHGRTPQYVGFDGALVIGPYGRSGPSAQASTGHGRRTSCSAARTGTGSRPPALPRWLSGSRHVRGPAPSCGERGTAGFGHSRRIPYLTRGSTAVDPHVGRVEHGFGGWVAPIRSIQTTSCGASIQLMFWDGNERLDFC